ncbi:MAG: DUF1643 domain-containing protein [Pseudomonadota bacterium]
MTLIVRHHSASGTTSSAVYSPCERYRYALTRTWGDGPRLTYVMLNPSKATEMANDPTVARCERRARLNGFGAMRVCNLFAWRETDPARLKKRRWPDGPDNAAQIAEAAEWAEVVLCAWGVHGAHRDAGPRMVQTLADRPLHALGVTKDGHPRHPLYCAFATEISPWAGYPDSL